MNAFSSIFKYLKYDVISELHIFNIEHEKDLPLPPNLMAKVSRAVHALSVHCADPTDDDSPASWGELRVPTAPLRL